MFGMVSAPVETVLATEEPEIVLKNDKATTETLALAGWRAIFVCLMSVAFVSLLWFALRQAETLPSERRGAFSRGGSGPLPPCEPGAGTARICRQDCRR